MSRHQPSHSPRIARRRVLTGTAGLGFAGLVLVACGDSGDKQLASGRTAGGDAAPGLVGSPAIATTQTPQPGGVLKSLLDEEPATLDPITPAGGVGNQIGAFVYSRLVRFKPSQGRFADGSIEGDLVARWEQPDAATMLMHLRDNVKWDSRAPTSGRPLAVEDIVLTWERFAATGTFRSDLAHAASKDAPIVSMRAVAHNTLELKLDAPDAQMLPTLASRFGVWVLPREAFGGGFDTKTDMRGTGPWTLDRHQASVIFAFKKNPNYYLGPSIPYLDAVELPIITDQAQAEAQFKARNIHGGPALGGPAVSETNLLDFHKSLRDTRIDLLPQNVLGPTIAFGYREGSLFTDARVRRAVSMLIDRDTFIEVFTNYKAFQAAGLQMEPKWATPLSAGWGPFWLDPKGSTFGPSARSYQHDVAEAKKLLAAAGFADGFETLFTFLAGAQWGRDWSQRAEALMAMLAKGGIRCKANAVDYNSVFIPQYLRSKGDFVGMAMQRTGSRGDPGQFWSVFFSSAGGSSQVGKNFPELDALIARQRKELDLARRIATHHDIQRWWGANMPAVPMGGHVQEPVLSWKGLHGPGTHFIWPGGDLGAEAYPYYWLDSSLRG